MGFSNFIGSLSQNPWISLISLFLTFIGLVITIVLHLRGKRKKAIRYCFKSDLLFEDSKEKIDGLTIKFLGKQISILTATKIIFWNNGTETLNREDFPSNDKFSIRIDIDYDILDVSIKQLNNIPIEVKIAEDGKKIDIDFEYLDKKDSFILQVFHTGNTNSNIFHVNGTIKGFGKLAKAKVSFTEDFMILPHFLWGFFIWLWTLSFIYRSPYVNLNILVAPFLLLIPIQIIRISIKKARTIIPKELKQLLKG